MQEQMMHLADFLQIDLKTIVDSVQNCKFFCENQTPVPSNAGRSSSVADSGS